MCIRDSGDSDLVEEFLARFAEPLKWPLEDEDAVRQRPEPGFLAIGQRHAFIEPQQVRILTLGRLGLCLLYTSRCV